MRKQYHLRASAAGLLAWDIDQLIALTKNLTLVQIPLAHLAELDENYWYSTADTQPTCRSIAQHMRLVQAADLAFPIILCPEGKLLDGMHRAVKALLEEREFIAAYRLPYLPEPDFIGVAPEDLPYPEDE